MNRAQKVELVANLNSIFKKSGVIIVAHYAGLSVAQMSELRSKMRHEGASVKVAKNRLVKLALKDTDVHHIEPLFAGPTVLAYSQDPVTAPKIAVDFAGKNEKFSILGGAMGATNLDVDAVKTLASMPSLDELRGKIIGLVQAPAGKIAQIVNAPAGQLARVLRAHATKEDVA